MVPGLPLAADTLPAAPVLLLMAVGVVVAIVGHAQRNRGLVGTGIALLFAATLLMMVLGYLDYRGDGMDPRPANDPKTPDF